MPDPSHPEPVEGPLIPGGVRLLRYRVPDVLDAKAPEARIERALGSGARIVLAYDRGRKYVSLLDPATLARIRVPLAELRHAEPLPLRPGRLARRLEARRRQWKRHGLPRRDAEIKRLIRELRRKP